MALADLFGSHRRNFTNDFHFPGDLRAAAGNSVNALPRHHRSPLPQAPPQCPQLPGTDASRVVVHQRLQDLRAVRVGTILKEGKDLRPNVL